MRMTPSASRLRPRLISCLVTRLVTGLLAIGAAFPAAAQISRESAPAPKKAWSFAVGGDSRNCGDIVMPAVGAGASAAGADFYWHLGDFRAIFDFDQDYLAEPEYREKR